MPKFTNPFKSTSRFTFIPRHQMPQSQEQVIDGAKDAEDAALHGAVVRYQGFRNLLADPESKLSFEGDKSISTESIEAAKKEEQAAVTLQKFARKVFAVKKNEKTLAAREFIDEKLYPGESLKINQETVKEAEKAAELREGLLDVVSSEVQANAAKGLVKVGSNSSIISADSQAGGSVSPSRSLSPDNFRPKTPEQRQAEIADKYKYPHNRPMSPAGFEEQLNVAKQEAAKQKATGVKTNTVT